METNTLLAGSGSAGIKVWNPALGDRFNNWLQIEGGSFYLTKLTSTLVTLFLIAGTIFFVFHFLLGGISWIQSGGDKAKLEDARSKVTQAITGLMVLLATYAVITLIEFVFGIDIVSITIPTL
jgi:hypothetical protein